MPTAKKSAQPAGPDLPLLEGEDPWTDAEVEEIRAELNSDIQRIEAQLEEAEQELADLLAEGGDGAGRDPADVGSANFERDQEMSLNANQREVLEQSRLALQRLDAGTYGSCEICGRPIGKLRLEAFPRATMCVSCKQREERR